MLPYIVLAAAAAYFLLKASGIFNRIKDDRKGAQDGPSTWSQRLLGEGDGEDERLEVFKEFLERDDDSDQRE